MTEKGGAQAVSVLPIYFVWDASVLSEKFVTQFAGPRRPWLRWASSEYSRYAVVGPPCQDHRWLADLCNDLLGQDTSNRCDDDAGRSIMVHPGELP